MTRRITFYCNVFFTCDLYVSLFSLVLRSYPVTPWLLLADATSYFEGLRVTASKDVYSVIERSTCSQRSIYKPTSQPRICIIKVIHYRRSPTYILQSILVVEAFSMLSLSGGSQLRFAFMPSYQKHSILNSLYSVPVHYSQGRHLCFFDLNSHGSPLCKPEWRRDTWAWHWNSHKSHCEHAHAHPPPRVASPATCSFR